ncbi:MAG: ANTAR domain-containing protein [Oscillospiraceae bacterium]|nr:ANTAR domain-containing protein [Oscillospiraceae bacterium]
MDSLIICFDENRIQSYVTLLRNAGVTDIAVSSGEGIREKILEHQYDIIVSVLPFEREFGLDTVAFISGRTSSEQVVFVPSKVYDEVCSKAVGLPVSILPKNIPASIALNTVRRAISVKESLDRAKNENDDLRRRAEDDKLIYRAKCVLIEYLKMSENEAHRYLQKRAMDRHSPVTQIAQDVLKTYEYRKTE